MKGFAADPFALENYTYELPEKQIASYPANRRSGSRLMVLDRRDCSLCHSGFQAIHEHLPPDSLLVVNTSTVVPARLSGAKETSRGKVEFLLLTPLPLIQPGMVQDEWHRAQVQGLIRPAKKVSVGQTIHFSNELQARVEQKDSFGQVRASLSWKNELMPLLQRLGRIPLPPYITRESEPLDSKRYQTIYADHDQAGSMAAATAGLHFDQEVLDKLEHKGIEVVPVNLFVGYGTFSPVRTPDIRDHRLHAEYVRVPDASAGKIQEAGVRGRPVVAVGTTTVRTLEGVRKKQGRIEPFTGWIDVYIYPGFRFRVVDHLLTNFHLPRSSLLLMIAAFAGRERILKAYECAVQSGYRFFSYGDAMLIL